MIKAKCIKDSGRPKEVPENKWLKKGSIYTIIKITVHPNQKNIQGCELSEITLDESCTPYEYFKLDRFAISKDDIPALIELMKLSSELSDIDIVKLLETEDIGLLT